MDQLVDHVQNTRGQIVDIKDSDAIAWGITEKMGKLTQIGIKHPNLGDDDVKIKITYTGICQSDVSILKHKYGDALPCAYPCVCGHEIVGRIISKGKNVENFAIDDLVGVGPIRNCCKKCTYCLKGKENLCSGGIYKFTAGLYFGGFATEIQLPANYLIKLPKEIKEKYCPSLFCAGGTIFAPLLKYGKQGSRVGIVGIGGLGHLGIMFANKMGMQVVVFSTSPNKKEDAFAMGAHDFVVSKDDNDMKRIYSEPLDFIINTSSVSNVMPYMRALKKGTGILCQPAIPESGIFELNWAEILFSQWTISTTAAFSLEDAQTMLDLVVKFDIYPKCEFFDWENFQEAYDKCANNTVEYRSIIDVESFSKKLGK